MALVLDRPSSDKPATSCWQAGQGWAHQIQAKEATAAPLLHTASGPGAGSFQLRDLHALRLVSSPGPVFV